MPRGRYKRSQVQYRRALAELLANAEACSWCHRPISTALPVGHPLKATADHYVPLSRGGTDDLGNLVPACSGCNNRRGNKTPEEWLRVLASENPRTHSREW